MKCPVFCLLRVFIVYYSPSLRITNSAKAIHIFKSLAIGSVCHMAATCTLLGVGVIFKEETTTVRVCKTVVEQTTEFPRSESVCPPCAQNDVSHRENEQDERGDEQNKSNKRRREAINFLTVVHREVQSGEKESITRYFFLVVAVVSRHFNAL